MLAPFIDNAWGLPETSPFHSHLSNICQFKEKLCFLYTMHACAIILGTGVFSALKSTPEDKCINGESCLNRSPNVVARRQMSMWTENR